MFWRTAEAPTELGSFAASAPPISHAQSNLPIGAFARAATCAPIATECTRRDDSTRHLRVRVWTESVENLGAAGGAGVVAEISVSVAPRRRTARHATRFGGKRSRMQPTRAGAPP